MKLLCFNCVCCCKVYGCTLNLLLEVRKYILFEKVWQFVYDCTDHSKSLFMVDHLSMCVRIYRSFINKIRYCLIPNVKLSHSLNLGLVRCYLVMFVLTFVNWGLVRTILTPSTSQYTAKEQNFQVKSFLTIN